MRNHQSWLEAYLEMVEHTESSRSFWLWSGLWALSSIVGRKLWLPFGIGSVFPNLYIMLIAPPGVARKGPPVEEAQRLVKRAGGSVFVDSPTKRALTAKLAKIYSEKTYNFFYEEGLTVQTPLALCSKELSSFLAVDPKAMIECLTDLYDCHSEWTYETHGSGEDIMENLYLSALFATTPTWITRNLPEEAIGGGFTTRFVMVYDDEPYKALSLPPPISKESETTLVQDLLHIGSLIGEVKFDPLAFELYDQWYQGLNGRLRVYPDERVKCFFSRIHTIALKVAICLSVDRSDDLILSKSAMATAISLLEHVLERAPKAFGAHGRSTLGELTTRVETQIRFLKETDLIHLLRINIRDLTKNELLEILSTLETMKAIKQEYQAGGGLKIYWARRKEGDKST